MPQACNCLHSSVCPHALAALSRSRSPKKPERSLRALLLSFFQAVLADLG